MITAKNYAAQAQRGLSEFANNLYNPSVAAKDKSNLNDFAGRIGRAVHFALPDNGVLFDDHLRGLKGTGLRLPFPEVTIEYFVENSERTVVGKGKTIRAPKRLVYACEIAEGMFPALFEPIPGVSFADVTTSGIGIMVANEVDGHWVPLPTGCFVPTNWDRTEGAIQVVKGNVKAETPHVVMAPIFVCPTIVKQLLAGKDTNLGLAKLVDGIKSEVAAVLEFCEAMTCSNVKAEAREKIDSSKNARRIKDGKLPLFETKILTIEVPGQSSSAIVGGSEQGERSGLRQHLRRGHIRTLSDGRKIWVTACIVGNASNGVISKSYNTLPGEQ